MKLFFTKINIKETKIIKKTENRITFGHYTCLLQELTQKIT